MLQLKPTDLHELQNDTTGPNTRRRRMPQRDVTNCFVGVYNNVRLHSKPGYRMPTHCAHEMAAIQATAVSAAS